MVFWTRYFLLVFISLFVLCSDDKPKLINVIDKNVDNAPDNCPSYKWYEYHKRKDMDVEVVSLPCDEKCYDNINDDIDDKSESLNEKDIIDSDEVNEELLAPRFKKNFLEKNIEKVVEAVQKDQDDDLDREILGELEHETDPEVIVTTDAVIYQEQSNDDAGGNNDPLESSIKLNQEVYDDGKSDGHNINSNNFCENNLSNQPIQDKLIQDKQIQDNQIKTAKSDDPNDEIDYSLHERN